jgi:hypothetical protein
MIAFLDAPSLLILSVVNGMGSETQITPNHSKSLGTSQKVLLREQAVPPRSGGPRKVV